MLPHSTRERIREAITRGVSPAREGFRVGVPVDHPDPDVSYVGVTPALRWSRQDIRDQEEPYQEVILRISGTTVESDAPADLYDKGRFLGTDDVSDEANDAHLRDTHGKPTRDELVIKTVAQGQIAGSIKGHEVTLSDGEIAEAVADAIHGYLLNRFKTRPIDEFDDEGNLVDQSELIYADELTPPVLPSADPMRMPDNVTEQVGRDDGTQYDSMLYLHYWDTTESYALSPTDAGIEARSDVDVTVDAEQLDDR